MSTTVLGKVSMTPKGAWNASTSYEPLDVVSYGGNAFLARRANSNVTPTEGADWQMIAEKATIGNLLQANGDSKTAAMSQKAVTASFGVKDVFDGLMSNGYWDTDTRTFQIISYENWIASTSAYPCVENDGVMLRYGAIVGKLGIIFWNSDNQMVGYEHTEDSNIVIAVAPPDAVKCTFHMRANQLNTSNRADIDFTVGNLLAKHEVLAKKMPLQYGLIVPPLDTVIKIRDTYINIPSLTRLYYGAGKTYRAITNGGINVNRVATSTSEYSEEILVFNENENEFRFVGGNNFALCLSSDVIVATFKKGLSGNSLPVQYTDTWQEIENQDLTNAIIQAHKVPSIPSNPTANLGLIHFSDIHADTNRLYNILWFSEKHANYIDDIVCSGDMVSNKFADSYDWWTNTSGSEKILVAIGNHDRWNGTLGDFTYAGASEAECYAKYIQPFYSNWGVVHDGTHTYYYKDYSDQKIRLVVLDCMLNETAQIEAQNSWLSSVLAGAKTSGFAVVIMEHYIPYRDNCEEVKCYFTSVKPKKLDPDGFNPIYQATVQTFIDGGGDFICYLAGHIHLDLIIKNKNYPNQWFIAVDTASMTKGHSYGDTERIAKTKCENLFNYITFNTTHKLVKIVRVGADTDSYLRSKKTLVFNYQTKEIISQN